MRFLIDLLYLLAAVIIAPVALYRMLRYNRYRSGWPQKLGRIQRRNPEKKCLWLHAVSMGEVNAAKTVLDRLAAEFPDHEILLTTTTDTGHARATALFAERFTVSFFPFDFSCVMNRAFRSIRPSLCLLMELEVWPNFVSTAKKQGVPVVVVNGRISDRSYRTYSKVRPLVKFMFSKVTLALAQTEEYAQRFTRLGCQNVIVSGSLKYDTAQTGTVPGADALANQLALDFTSLVNSNSTIVNPKSAQDSEAIINNKSSIINSKSPPGRESLVNSKSTIVNPKWVLGGTGNDEEAILLDVYEDLKKDPRFADLRLVVVPRKPERFEEVAQLIKARGFQLIRYSQIKEASDPQTLVNSNSKIVNPKASPPPRHCEPSQSEGAAIPNAANAKQPPDPKSLVNSNSKIINPQDDSVILGDTMGDLRKFYSLATIIFVGRSLVPMGGSDMMEAAALGKCTIFGPHTFNFKQTVDALLKAEGAIMAKDKQDLLQIMKKCLTDPAYASHIAENGRKVIIQNQGATAKTVEEIKNLLHHDLTPKPRLGGPL